jgi:ATP-dependent Clp endopeptidase proteolytic subunit ClpP
MDYEAASSKSSTHHSPHVNLKRIDNTIFFSDKINYDSAHQLNTLLKVIELDILDDIKTMDGDVKKSKSKYADVRIDPKPIILHLTTNGGLVHAAFSIVDTIKSLKVPVHTVVSGYVASAGTLISLAGTKRYITSNSFMMIHEIRSGFWGKFSDARVEYENVTKLMEHVIKYYVEHTKLSKERLTEMLRADNDLPPAECKELGLVDTIGTP